MPDRDFTGVPSLAYWEKKAEEARVLAEGMKDLEAKATMQRVAQMYETMAKRAAARPKS